MTTMATDTSTRRRMSLTLPASLIVQLDRMAAETGQPRTRFVEALLADDVSRLASNSDPDALLCELRRHEPDIPLEECTDLLARVEELLKRWKSPLSRQRERSY